MSSRKRVKRGRAGVTRARIGQRFRAQRQCRLVTKGGVFQRRQKSAEERRRRRGAHAARACERAGTPRVCLLSLLRCRARGATRLFCVRCEWRQRQAQRRIGLRNQSSARRISLAPSLPHNPPSPGRLAPPQQPPALAAAHLLPQRGVVVPDPDRQRRREGHPREVGAEQPERGVADDGPEGADRRGDEDPQGCFCCCC